LKILIAGAGGMVGGALTEHCTQKGDQVFAYDRLSLDISNAARVEELLVAAEPDAVINCAAWTDVDGCENDEARAFAVNASGPENLARACRKVGSVFVTISTDYVFDGAKDDFYTQRDNPNPISVYAHSKLAGELKAQQEHARTIVVRSGYIFGAGGSNFLSTVVDRVRRGEKLKVIRDAWGTPTSGKHLAVRLRELAELDLPGIYHVVNSGEGATFESFSRAALQLAGCDQDLLEAVSFDSLNRPAPRPRNSKLRCLLSDLVGLHPMPSLHDGMVDYFGSKVENYTETEQFSA
jgi:dTDP-4-dehydrorhamnose reductase